MTLLSTPVFALAVLAASVGLATSAHPNVGAASTTGSPAACPSLSEAGALPRWQSGGLLHADVDRDGSRDEVGIHYAARALSSCGFLLVLKTHRRVFSVRVPESYEADQPIRRWPLHVPFLVAVVQAGGGKAQIVVGRLEGASILTVSLYAIAGKKLVLLHFRSAYDPNGLQLYGTVGTGSTSVRCARGGPLTVISTWPTTETGKRFGLSTTTYRLGRAGYSVTGRRTVFGPNARVSLLAHRAGLDDLPFTGCTLARGRMF